MHSLMKCNKELKEKKEKLIGMVHRRDKKLSLYDQSDNSFRLDQEGNSDGESDKQSHESHSNENVILF